MNLPPYLSRNHWKNYQPYKSVLSTACYVYSLCAISIPTVSYFIPKFEEWSRGNISMFFTMIAMGLIIGIFHFLRKCIKMLSVSQKITGADISIEIQVGDIFNHQGAFIISTNTTFDTDMSGGLISKDSLQGQFTEKYYADVKYLDQDLEKELESQYFTPIDAHVRGKKKRYEYGTVVMLRVKEQLAYWIAIADMNEHGVAAGSYEKMTEILGKLWHYISERGEYVPLVIPVLGTGRGRINVPREEMIREIIKSFITAYSEKKFCEKLIIVISNDDYRKHGIDLQELRNYLRHLCLYTDFKSYKDAGKGKVVDLSPELDPHQLQGAGH